MRPRLTGILFALVTTVTLVAGCGDGNDNEASPSPSPSPTERATPSPAVTPTPAPTAAPTPAPTPAPTAPPTAAPTAAPTATQAPTAPPDPAVRLSLSADNIAFSTGSLGVPAGADVIIDFTNHEVAPHNFTLWESSATQNRLFGGSTFSGPNQTRTYEFTAPSAPGTYFFNCTIHPNQMTGDFIVQ